MALSSSSTLADVKAEYMNKAGIRIDGGVVECAEFIPDCELRQLPLPKRTGTREFDTELNTELIEKRMTAAQEWLGARGGGGETLDSGAGGGGAGTGSGSVSNQG